jgi:hypothetical protein
MRRPHIPQIGLLKICLLRIFLMAVLLSPALAAHAQGCSMCRDTTAGSAPQIRAGLRRAIPILAVPAIALFVGFFVVARRTKTWHRPDPEALNPSDPNHDPH